MDSQLVLKAIYLHKKNPSLTEKAGIKNLLILILICLIAYLDLPHPDNLDSTAAILLHNPLL